MHNAIAKGQELQKIAMGYWSQMTFHLLIQSKVGVQKGKGKSHNEHSKILYANRLQILSRKSPLAVVFDPFRAYVKLCFSNNWRSLVTKEFHSLLALDQISVFLDRFFGFSIQEPLLQSSRPFCVFNLTSTFFLFFISFFVV